jgi:two-component system response regulator AtoC
MAETIHLASDRRMGPLIKVNCAALPETLLESELFGHEKGAFTGAIAQHKGRFEAAHKGTIFLDEIGEMTMGTQKKLLRVLQEREFERVGGTAPVKVDVRVVAATNKNLREEVLAGRFREDLFYRLNVIAVHMPPLRERRDDIPALVAHFLDKHRFSPTTPPARISEDAMAVLERYDWPGNVRELENIIERAVVMSRGGVITTQHIVFANELNRYVLDVDQKVRQKTPLEDILREVEREALRAALRQSDQDQTRAASLLGLSEAQIARRLSELLPETL